MGKHSKTNDTKDKKISKENKSVNEKKSMNKALKVIIVMILIFMIIAGCLIAGGYFYVKNQLSKMQQVEINKDDLEINNDLDGYRNIAFFGLDSRKGNLNKDSRSDCIVIASINERTKEVKLISIYRDTYVQLAGHNFDKITHAYYYGEAQLALKTINLNLDLNVSEFITVNFDIVAEVVDLLGGVDIYVKEDEVDELNLYIADTMEHVKLESDLIPTAGFYTLNGVQAVAYSRIRHLDGGDYRRTERIRDVIDAILEKSKTKNLFELNNILNKVLPEIYTNISSDDFMALVPDLSKYNVEDSVGWPYLTKGYTLDKWYGIPVTLESNVVKLHKEVFGEEDYEASEKVKQLSNTIISRTGYKEETQE